MSSEMITGPQIRGARGFLRWSISDLAKASGVSVPTIQRLEMDDGVPSGRSQTLAEIKTALETAGIEFIGAPDNGPGVRFRPKS